MASNYIRWVPSVPVMRFGGRIHTWLYRLTRGLIGSRADGLDMLLLTTRGRRTGRLRTTPLPFFRLDGNLLLIASFGGNDLDPAWVGNLHHDPRVTVQYRGKVSSAEASISEGEERSRLWKAVTSEHPRYIEYQARTRRQIPVVVLEGAAV